MTVAPPGPVASAVMSAGSVSVGAVVSWTVMSTVPDARLWWASSAEQLTVVVPMANVEPEAAEQTGVIAPSTMSVAVAV